VRLFHLRHATLYARTYEISRLGLGGSDGDHIVPGEPRVDADRRAAAGVHRGERAPLALDAQLGRRIVDGGAQYCGDFLVPGSRLDRERALARRRYHLLELKRYDVCRPLP
jgi:hypothetical protein